MNKLRFKLRSESLIYDVYHKGSIGTYLGSILVDEIKKKLAFRAYVDMREQVTKLTADELMEIALFIRGRIHAETYTKNATL